jgi:hypothetical protein
MVYLDFGQVEAKGPTLVVTNILTSSGRLTAVENEPLLEAVGLNGGGLILYGKPGSNYTVETSSALTSWQPAFDLHLDGVMQITNGPVLTNQPLFYRVHEK